MIRNLIRRLQALERRVARLETLEQPVVRTANIEIDNASPDIVLKETDQSLPAGLWRIVLDGDIWYLQRNTAAGGDFSTVDTIYQADSTELKIEGTLTIED